MWDSICRLVLKPILKRPLSTLVLMRLYVVTLASSPPGVHLRISRLSNFGRRCLQFRVDMSVPSVGFYIIINYFSLHRMNPCHCYKDGTTRYLEMIAPNSSVEPQCTKIFEACAPRIQVHFLKNPRAIETQFRDRMQWRDASGKTKWHWW